MNPVSMFRMKLFALVCVALIAGTFSACGDDSSSSQNVENEISNEKSSSSVKKVSSSSLESNVDIKDGPVSRWVNEDGKSINGSDAYSFTALPAGCWNAEDLDFVLQGVQTDFWSSTETDSNFSYCATIGENTYVNVISCGVKFGRSVRCVKD